VNKTTKDLITYTEYIKYWTGIQSRIITTSNKAIKDLNVNGVNSLISIVLIKLILKYEPLALRQALNDGIEFVYQTYTYSIQKQKAFIRFTMKHTKTNTMVLSEMVVSVNSLKAVTKIDVNQDVLDVLDSLIRKGL
jgi:hypothetical protein